MMSHTPRLLVPMIALTLAACSSDEPGGAGPEGAGATAGAGTGGAGTGGSGGASAGNTGGAGAQAGGGSPSASGGNQPGSGGTGTGGAAPSSGGSTPGPGGSAGSSGSSSGGMGGAPSPDPDCGTRAWACWPMPNPSGSGLPNPASYRDEGDVVHDEVTGLVWQKQAPSETFTWQAALDHCAALDLGGRSDWRLPSRVELMSIMDFTASGAKLDASAFPGAQGGFHKTASDWVLTILQTGAGSGRDFAWAFNLSDGIVSNAYSKAEPARLRCVSGGSQSGEAPGTVAVRPPDQYTLVAEGEVRDNYTGLVWERGYSSAQLSWQDAVAYCENLALNGQSWRLPSIRELSTLVDEALVAPSIDRDWFPDTRYGARSNHWYWASHTAQNNPNAAWALNFDDGFTGFNAGSEGAWNHFTQGWAKCVR